MRKTAGNFILTPGRVIRWLLLAGVILYVLICVGFAVFQRRLIYLPPRFTAQQVDDAARKAGLERWKNPAGQAIGMERLSSQQPPAGRVLLVYGQGSWSVGCAHYVEQIQTAAPSLDMYILEYPGYGDRTGPPSQQAFFRAADEALQLLGTNEPVYIVGESLGTGVAAYLAGAHPASVAGLILLSPYNSLVDVAQYRKPFLPVWLILADRFPAEDYLRNYHGPVGIMVDGLDYVVPEKFGQRLFDGYAGTKKLWRSPLGGHISLPQPRTKFWAEVVDFWRTNQTPASHPGN